MTIDRAADELRESIHYLARISPGSYHDTILTARKQFIETVLLNFKGNQFRAAEALGMHRNTISRQIDDLGIDLGALKQQVREGRRAMREAQPERSYRLIVRHPRTSEVQL